MPSMKYFKKGIAIHQIRNQLLHPFQTNDYTVLKLQYFTYINLIHQYLEFATVTTIQSIEYNNFTFCVGVHALNPGSSCLNGLHFINLLGSSSHFCLLDFFIA
jgi:hypothetical protein